MYYKDFLTKENEFKFNTWVANDISSDYRVFFEQDNFQIITPNKDLFNGLCLRLQISINYNFWWADYSTSPSDYAQCFKTKNSDNIVIVSFVKW